MDVLVEKKLKGVEAVIDSENEAVFFRPLKIAFCLPDHHCLSEMRGGEPKNAAMIQQRYIAEGLRARGHSLTYLAPRDLDRMVCTDDLNEPTLAPQTWTSSWLFNLISKAAWKIQQIFRIPYLNYFSNYRRYDACLQCLAGQDVVFERNAIYNAGVAMACKKLNLPYVLFFDADQIAELDYLGTPITGWLRRRASSLLRYNLSVARCVICVSEPAKTHLIKNWNVLPDRIVVMPNGVDVERFKPDLKLQAETRASLRLENRPLVVFVGGFYRWHDVTTLLNGFAKVLESHREASLVLVGDGTERARMMSRAVELGIEHAVQFTGFVIHDEVSRFVNAADIAVVPVPLMKQDLWLSPMKLFEYMASAKAVVACAMGQILSVIEDGRNGLLVPPGDAPALADAINRLITDDQLRARLGQRARQDTVQKHSWERYVSRLERVYNAVIAGQPVNLI